MRTSAVLTEIQSRQLLQQYGIRQNRYAFADSKEQALQLAGTMDKPLVMKVVSDKIVHKTDFGGVQLGLMSQEDVAQAFDAIYDNAAKKGVKPEEIQGVTLQEYVVGVQEMVIGVKRDAVFGPVLLVGIGGVLVELMKDVTLGICELEEREIYQMLTILKGFSLLDGFRGRKKADIPALVELIRKVQTMALNEASIVEMDINPVIVREEGQGAVAVDARIVVIDNTL